MRRSRLSVLVRATTLASVLTLVSTTAAHADPPGRTASGSGSPTTPADGSADTHVVTLPTGDTVTVSTDPEGRHSYSVRPAARPDRRALYFRGTTVGDDLYVVPSDAEPYLASGAVDRQLFNVTELVREGDADDARSLPLIVTYRHAPGPATLAATTDALPGSTRTRTLTAIHGAAVRVDRRTAAQFWEGIDVDGPAANASTLTFGHDIATVWLDRRVSVTLDQSVPQIGAPTAWQAGVDGTGVKVAVLDTGIDPAHPDFAGRIVATANFSTSPSVQDRNGHGTHVASIVAGSGAASDGRYRGVAPGASLLIGKVLDDTGHGPTSSVIAGMQWAAQQGARVINFSLSSDSPSDSNDPLSLAVDDISHQYGVLVVAAAGNNYNIHTVYAPGAAESALAVGAVDKQDRLANFSSKGPGLVNAAVKPEITAPGVDIVAARAAGSTLGPAVGERYMRLNGTSMATPHVTGSAVLLAEAHPDWSGEDLRRALVSTAKDDGYAWYQQGAGRVDVTRAFTQHVYGSRAINFGNFAFPQSGTATRPATFSNGTDAAVTLNLSLDVRGWTGQPSPAGAVRLDSGSVTVPAHGQASVNLTVDPTVGPNSVYGGVLTASTADGSVRLRTPLSWRKSPQTQDVTVRLIDANGQPVPSGRVEVTRVDFPVPDDPFVDATTNVFVTNGVGRITLPSGTYSMHALVDNVDLRSRRLTLVVDPEIQVPGTGEVVLDARTAVPVRPRTPRPTQNAGIWLGISRTSPAGQVVMQEDTSVLMLDVDVYVTPTAPVRTGAFAVYDRWALEPALLHARTHGGPPMTLHPSYDPVLAAPKFAGQHTLPVVFAGQGSPADLAAANVSGALALVRMPAPENSFSGVFDGQARARQIAVDAAAAGAAGVLVYLDLPGALPLPMLASDPILELALGQSEGDTLRAAVARRPVSVSLDGSLNPDRIYRLRYDHLDGLRPDYRNTVDDRKLAVVHSEYHSDKPNLADFEAWHSHSAAFPSSAVVTRTFWVPTAPTELVAQPSTPGFYWDRWVFQSSGPTTGSGTFIEERTQYPASARPRHEVWFGSPVHTGMPETLTGDQLFCSMCRDNDWLIPPEYEVDTDPQHGYFLFDSGAGTTVSASANGTDLTVDTSRGYPRIALPADPSTVTLTTHTRQRITDIRTLAPTVDTTWTFHSERPTGHMSAQYLCRVGRSDPCAFQPMLQLRYDLGLNLLNQAPAGLPWAFTVTAGAHSEAAHTGRIAGMRVWTSTDGNRTWQRAVSLPVGGGEFVVLVRHPSLDHTDQHVSLRVQAWDTAGNRVDQTVTHAYALTDQTWRR